MKNILLVVSLILATATAAFADTASPLTVVTTTTTATAPVAVLAPAVVPAPGFGPAVILTATQFFFNGKYQILSGSPMAGVAYTWDQASNVNSAGVFSGPAVTVENGVEVTTLNVLAHLNLFQTTAGALGIGVGTQLWGSNTKGVKVDSNTSYFTFDFTPNWM